MSTRCQVMNTTAGNQSSKRVNIQAGCNIKGGVMVIQNSYKEKWILTDTDMRQDLEIGSRRVLRSDVRAALIAITKQRSFYMPTYYGSYGSYGVPGNWFPVKSVGHGAILVGLCQRFSTHTVRKIRQWAFEEKA